MVVAGYRNG